MSQFNQNLLSSHKDTHVLWAYSWIIREKADTVGQRDQFFVPGTTESHVYFTLPFLRDSLNLKVKHGYIANRIGVCLSSFECVENC